MKIAPQRTKGLNMNESYSKQRLLRAMLDRT
jgi:hypothetical protein